MKEIRVFIDSDVVISSLLSNSGAANLLIHTKLSNITKYVSNFSVEEIELVANRLNIQKGLVQKTISGFEKVMLKEDNKEVRNKYKGYVNDKNDAHIVAGAIEAKTKFLITYNIKDFKVDKLKADYNIIVIPPGHFLQYLRGLSF